MQPAAKSPYEGKLCAIVVKAQMRVNGKLRPAGSETEARIKKWMREGVILEDDGFLPWGSVYSVSPLEPLGAPGAGTQPVELTKDEIYYLWVLTDRAVRDIPKDTEWRPVIESAERKLGMLATKDEEGEAD